jgi:hypothetical protein
MKIQRHNFQKTFEKELTTETVNGLVRSPAAMCSGKGLKVSVILRDIERHTEQKMGVASLKQLKDTALSKSLLHPIP